MLVHALLHGIPVVVIYIPFVLRYTVYYHSTTTLLHRCPAAMPHVVSRLMLLLCYASLCLCLCSLPFIMLGLFLHVDVNLEG